MLSCAICQPHYLPWLGYFEMIERVDIFVFLDDVQFMHGGWQNRDKIKTRDGVRWLTVPIAKKNKFGQLICETMINESTDWRNKHIKTIEGNYKKSPNFERVFEKLRDIYAKKQTLLIELNMDLLQCFAEEFGITTPFVFASEYQIKSNSTQRLIELIKAVNGTTYLSGTGARDYMDNELFRKSGIELIFQEYTPPVYPQLHGDFVAGLSCLDFAMNCTSKIYEYVH